MLSLLLTEDALLSVEAALTEPVLAVLDAEVPSAPGGGGGGGGCCNAANSSSSTLDNCVELSLLLAEVEALVAPEALVVSEADVLSLADRPDRKLMFSSWKYAGGVGADWPSSAELLLLSLLLLLAELLLVDADAC